MIGGIYCVVGITFQGIRKLDILTKGCCASYFYQMRDCAVQPAFRQKRPALPA